MPVYEYACTDCGQHLEVRQNFTDEPLTTCEVCGGRLRKLLSPVGVVFKGSGFYRTDSRTTPPSEGAAASDGKSSDSSGKSSKEGATTSPESGGKQSSGSGGPKSGSGVSSTTSTTS